MGNKVNRWECNVCGKKCTAIAESITGECKKSGVCMLTVAEIPDWKEVDAEPKDADRVMREVLTGLAGNDSVRIFRDGSGRILDGFDKELGEFHPNSLPLTTIATAITKCKPTREQSLELVAAWTADVVKDWRRPGIVPDEIKAALYRIKEAKGES